MLLAVESHPAMLIYLDNARSIGPDSIAGHATSSRGLNENLAREILELHTLGVRTVYTQEDVTSFAKVITGWTMIPLRQDPGARRRVRLQSAHARAGHADGDRQDLSRQRRSSRAAPCSPTLARHPATAKHVATKLARHFVADDPPPALVERLAKRFLETEGDLKEVAKALVTAPEVLAAARGKAQAAGRMDHRGAARRPA